MGLYTLVIKEFETVEFQTISKDGYGALEVYEKEITVLKNTTTYSYTLIHQLLKEHPRILTQVSSDVLQQELSTYGIYSLNDFEITLSKYI